MAYTGPGNPDSGSASVIPTARRRHGREIGIVLFDGFSLLRAGVIPEVFQLANELYSLAEKGEALYDVRFFSALGGGVACSSSISVWTYAWDVRSVAGFDALFIAGGDGARHAAQDERVITWLRDVLPLCDMVKAIGEGRVLLEAARYGGSSRFPSMDVGSSGFHGGTLRRESLEVDERYEPVQTALTLVKRDLGGEAVREIARRLSSSGASLLTSIFQEGSTVTATAKVRASARWLKDNCERPISISDAARVAAMSERNFLRCFKQEMGVTPSEYLLQARLEMTSRLLTETDLPIDKIARRCGWINGDRMAKIFRKRLALTPSGFRARVRDQMLGGAS